MDKLEQAEFVVCLLDRIKGELVEKISRGNVPANWDGHELRKWINAKTSNEVTELMRDGKARRLRDYWNDVETLNL